MQPRACPAPTHSERFVIPSNCAAKWAHLSASLRACRPPSKAPAATRARPPLCSSCAGGPGCAWHMEKEHHRGRSCVHADVYSDRILEPSPLGAELKLKGLHLHLETSKHYHAAQ